MRLALLAFLIATPVLAGDTPPTPAAVKKDLEAGKAIIYDVRTPKEWDAGHLKAAKPLPISRINKGIPEAELKKLLPTDKTVYLYCNGPGRCVLAEETLTKLGYKVQAVHAGYKGLAAAGLETVETPAKK